MLKGENVKTHSPTRKYFKGVLCSFRKETQNVLVDHI